MLEMNVYKMICLHCHVKVFSEQSITLYSGTSLIRSPTGLGKIDFNWQVTVLQGAK